jgi:hypothetical protein
MYFFSRQNISMSRAKWLALFVLLLNYQPSFAQNNNDAEPKKNPVLPYQSVFGSFQSYKDQPVSPWREVNDEVEKIGGWRAYAREASEGSTSEVDQVEVQDKTDALPANKTHQHHGGNHE